MICSQVFINILELVYIVIYISNSELCIFFPIDSFIHAKQTQGALLPIRMKYLLFVQSLSCCDEILLSFFFCGLHIKYRSHPAWGQALETTKKKKKTSSERCAFSLMVSEKKVQATKKGERLVVRGGL